MYYQESRPSSIFRRTVMIGQQFSVLRLHNSVMETSLKAFSHQRRAKPFNTLRSKADSFEKSHFKFDTSIFGQKAVSAEKPLLPKSRFWPKNLIKFDPFLTDPIQKDKKIKRLFL